MRMLKSLLTNIPITASNAIVSGNQSVVGGTTVAAHDRRERICYRLLPATQLRLVLPIRFEILLSRLIWQASQVRGRKIGPPLSPSVDLSGVNGLLAITPLHGTDSLGRAGESSPRAGCGTNFRVAHPLAIGEHEQASLPAPHRSGLAPTGPIIIGVPNQSELCTVSSRKPALPSRSRHCRESG
jgi:hypothetical protein